MVSPCTSLSGGGQLQFGMASGYDATESLVPQLRCSLDVQTNPQPAQAPTGGPSRRDSHRCLSAIHPPGKDSSQRPIWSHVCPRHCQAHGSTCLEDGTGAQRMSHAASSFIHSSEKLWFLRNHRCIAQKSR